jgi:hypothetical protein
MVSGGAAAVGFEVLFLGSMAVLAAMNNSGKKQDANGGADNNEAGKGSDKGPGQA